MKRCNCSGADEIETNPRAVAQRSGHKEQVQSHVPVVLAGHSLPCALAATAPDLDELGSGAVARALVGDHKTNRTEFGQPAQGHTHSHMLTDPRVSAGPGGLLASNSRAGLVPATSQPTREGLETNETER
jgi:hypothetical protein